MNIRYHETLAQVIDELEYAHQDMLFQARLIAMETDFKMQTLRARETDENFIITPELLLTCNDDNVKRCLRVAHNIMECLLKLGDHYRQMPLSVASEN